MAFDDFTCVADMSQDPPPWIPADNQHTTVGASTNAQLHMLRAVDTGIINVSDTLLDPCMMIHFLRSFL